MIMNPMLDQLIESEMENLKVGLHTTCCFQRPRPGEMGDNYCDLINPIYKRVCKYQDEKLIDVIWDFDKREKCWKCNYNG